MLGSYLNAAQSPTPKKIYRAARVSGSKTQKIEKKVTKGEKVVSNFSPTPVKFTNLKDDKELNSDPPTQEIKPEQDFQVYGKRKPDFEIINRLKYFKKSEGSMLGQKVICLLNLETQQYENFKFYMEDEIIQSEVDLSIEQISEDYPTSFTQIGHCKEFLEKELENAILNA